MSCSMTKYDAGSGDRIQELSIQSPMLYHYATVLHWLQLVPNAGEKIISTRLYFFLHFSSNSSFKFFLLRENTGSLYSANEGFKQKLN